MGLDMYLRRKRYLGKAKLKIIGNEYDWYKNIGEEINNVSYIEEEIGYWRKANQIHNWFVENVQNGNDDCHEYEVSYEKAQDLLKICKDIKQHCKLKKGKVINGETLKDGKWVPIIEDGKVMTNKKYAENLLPTVSGFFFGSTEYNQWYMQDIEDTIKILEKIQPDDTIYYNSSW